MRQVTIFPKTHYVTPREVMLNAISYIKEELSDRLTALNDQNKLVEFFYRSRPYELYKYARYLKLLGYKKESIHTTKIAHKLMLNNRMIYQNDTKLHVDEIYKRIF